VRAIVGQIAQGLLYAHSRGVVHRDLKPGNVLVDRSGQVQLTDFGLSRLLESEVLEGKAVGTPTYMPPEQFQTDRVGPECDWYALGCLTCEMLTSRILFMPRKWLELYEVKRAMKPSEHWPNVPASGELREVINGCLEPNPGDRHVDLKRLSAWANPVPWLFQSVARSPGSQPK
jgi:serine/threonine protein kinase